MRFRAKSTPESTIDAEDLSNSMLQKHFFPNQAANIPETPPSIDTSTFTRKCAVDIVQHLSARKVGYDAVSYKLTRTNLTLRHAHIPHPVPYANLVMCIERNWSSIDHIVDNERSMLRPMVHPDGRMFVFDGYGESEQVRVTQALEERFARRYVVKTDVKNLYPSIYSHSIAWALVGRSVAKTRKNYRTDYFNELDSAFRGCRRNETNGVLIGPGTSNLAAEIVLGAVDQSLSNGGHSQFHRFVDDYTYFALTLPEAEDFIQALSKELSQFELHLNEAKTEVIELPAPLKPGWMTALSLFEPRQGDGANRVRAFLDQAISLSSEKRDSSILVYAVTVLLNSLDDERLLEMIPRPLLNLCFHRPRLIPLLDKLFRLDGDMVRKYEKDLNVLARESLKGGRSDMASWCFHYPSFYQATIESTSVQEAIIAGDCIPLLVGYAFDQISSTELGDLLDTVAKEDDDYAWDRYWPLTYELYRRESKQFGQDAPAFDILAAHDVSFVHADEASF